MRFYGAFNALYCRTKSSNSELVCVELLKSFCLPMILYASEVTDPTKSVLAMLDNLIDRAVVKIFKSQEIVLFMKLDTSLDCMMLHPCVKRGV